MESKGRPALGDMREESALNMFRQMDLKGKTRDDTQLNTVHQNTISTVRSYDEAEGNVKKFSSKQYHTASKMCHDAELSQRAVWMVELWYGPHRIKNTDGRVIHEGSIQSQISC